MRKLETQVDIDAPLEAVWHVLADLSGYKAWNPFIVQVDGECITGRRVSVQMNIPGKGVQHYQVMLTEVSRPRVLRWLGHFHLPGLIDGDHSFELDLLPDGKIRVRQDEVFRGLLVPFVWRGFLQRHLLPCFERLNDNLKAHLEKRPLPHALPSQDPGQPEGRR